MKKNITLDGNQLKLFLHLHPIGRPIAENDPYAPGFKSEPVVEKSKLPQDMTALYLKDSDKMNKDELDKKITKTMGTLKTNPV